MRPIRPPVRDPEFDWTEFLRRQVNRWTPQRKATFVDAVRAGKLDLASMLVKHRISIEEYASWVAARAAARQRISGVVKPRYQPPAYAR